MKSYLCLSVALCLCAVSRGTPLKGSSPGEKFLERIREEVNFRNENNEPLILAFEENSGATRFVNLTYEVETSSSSYLPSLNYTLFVEFYLFQRENNGILATKIPMDAKEILGEGFKKTRDTKVIIHGFANDHTSSMIQETSQGFASDSKYNVIAVDWGKISNSMNYLTARYHVEGVGEYVGQFLSMLYNASMIKPSRLHLIGHSLGAHLAGFAGKTVKKEGWTLGRITGLDPAGPLFNDPTERMSKNDAATVDVIHTCAKYLGIDGNIGHVDFYPNGGVSSQPGCGFDWTGICSHSRAYEYFAESITHPGAFIGKYCEIEENSSVCDPGITAVMGAELSYKFEGTYSLTTGKSAPFGLGQNGV